jgi:hypothetical protein
MKVRAGSEYQYRPVGFDLFDPKTRPQLQPGDIVKVVNLRGCPPANTMGQCHVEKDGKFVGMVATASLVKVSDNLTH